MRYDPKQATEPGGNPGTYYFTIANAEEKVSGQGNEMMKLAITVHLDSSRSMTVYDYIVATPGGLWKAKMLCKEIGLDFDAGNLTVESVIGKSGQVVVDYDKGDLAKVNTGDLAKAYLKVMRYGIHKTAQAPTNASPGQRRAEDPSPPVEQEVSDGIPF